MSRHLLKSGGWIEMRDAAEVTERQRRKGRKLVQRVSPSAREAMASGDVAHVAEVMSGDDAEVMFELNDLVAASMISEWSWADREISADTLPDLPQGDYDEILEITAVGVTAFFGVDFDPTPDRSSPTLPSGA